MLAWFSMTANQSPSFTGRLSLTSSSCIFPAARVTTAVAGCCPVNVMSAVITSGYLKKQLPTSNATTTRNNSVIPHRTIQAGICPITSCTSSLRSSISFLSFSISNTIFSPL